MYYEDTIRWTTIKKSADNPNLFIDQTFCENIKCLNVHLFTNFLCRCINSAMGVWCLLVNLSLIYIFFFRMWSLNLK